MFTKLKGFNEFINESNDSMGNQEFELVMNISFEWANLNGPKETVDEMVFALNDLLGGEVEILDAGATGTTANVEWTDRLAAMDLEDYDEELSPDYESFPYDFSGEAYVIFSPSHTLSSEEIEDLKLAILNDYTLSGIHDGDFELIF